MSDVITDITLVKDVEDIVCWQAMLVSVEDAQRLVHEINRTETLMPFVDPTGWRKIQDTEGGHKKVAEAFSIFRKELEKVRQG